MAPAFESASRVSLSEVAYQKRPSLCEERRQSRSPNPVLRDASKPADIILFSSRRAPDAAELPRDNRGAAPAGLLDRATNRPQLPHPDPASRGRDPTWSPC